ncbi:MAG: thioredoxin domain-containing protein [Variibacter sp.]
MTSTASQSASHHQNRLGSETSPYLLQHKNNPVAWWPWGPQALGEAERTGKPILLSVGYAACHWCHVMAHESFEDPATAAVMNDLFVNIKVDREERPDIDQIYMNALHHLGEQGGWPLTMFLTPKGEPFWGGTYFPNTSRYGRPAFTDVLREVARLFREEPSKIEQNRGALMERLAERARPAGRVVIGFAELDRLAEQLGGAIDPVHGGLRGAPKFPQASLFELLWRAGTREEGRSSAFPSSLPGLTRQSIESSQGDESPGHDASRRPGDDEGNLNRYLRVIDITLRNICEGGIYDHLGGGFSRYSVDERWLVPHFEKMLYDNAQLLELLALAWRRTGNDLYRRRARETVGWLAREMTNAGGAFTSSLDADSEGEEGKFYVWSRAEIEAVLGADAAQFAAVYDVTAAGNFEGRTILNRLKDLPRNIARSKADEGKLAVLREKLLAVREKRVRPGLDDKVLADWNGLMISALTRAALVFGEPGWLDRAQRAFAFVATQMTRGDRLGHSWRDGRLLFPGLASDFAAMIRAALALNEATGEGAFLAHAIAWQTALDRHYANPDNGGYFLTADDAEGLVVRPHATNDDATPNANATAAENLVRLAVATGNDAWRARADRLFDGLLPTAAANAFGHAALLNALDLRLRAREIVVTGAGANADALTRAALAQPWLDRMVMRSPHADALPAGHPARDKLAAAPAGAAAFVCAGETCSLPATTPEQLAALL